MLALPGTPPQNGAHPLIYLKHTFQEPTGHVHPENESNKGVLEDWFKNDLHGHYGEFYSFVSAL